MAITELSVCGPGGDELCRLGMQGPGGGYVFFIDHEDLFPSFCATGDCNYLEFAPKDAASSITWCSSAAAPSDGNSRELDAGWDKRAIGAGRTNTARMLDTSAEPHCTSGAAVEADEYAVPGGAGAGEWWLPSVAELMALFRVSNEFGVGDLTTSTWYWSSSERDMYNAWRFGSRSGQLDWDSKTSTSQVHVRAIRAF